MEEEEEALSHYCRAMVLRVRSRQQQAEAAEEEEERRRRRRRGGKEERRRRSESDRRAASGDGAGAHRRCDPQQRSDLPPPGPESQPAPPGPESQPAPPRLLTLLTLKTLEEDMRRAVEVEFHDPAVCSVCEQQRAALALKSFIRRKKTQLQFQTVQGRLGVLELWSEVLKTETWSHACPTAWRG